MANDIIDGKYEIIARIGSGGTSIVYKARRLADDMIVAVKVIRDELDDTREHERNFRLETAALSKMSHRNVRRILSVGKWNDSLYMVTEFIDGCTLKDIVNSEGALNTKKAVDYALQIVAGIEHAHRRGIIHRDIKPQNILVANDGTVKLVDFGIARMTSQTTRTMAGKDALGSVHYLSPEQARGANVDGRTDIYSFGILLYEMFTGNVPFEGSEPVSIAMKHVNERPEAPIKLNPEMPKGMNDIILKCMQKDPDARYQTAWDLREDLLLFVANPNGFCVKLTDKKFNSQEQEENVPKRNVTVDEPVRRRRKTEPVASRGNRPVKTKVSYISDEERKKDNAGKNRRNLMIVIAAVLSVVVIATAVGIIVPAIVDDKYPESEIPAIYGLSKNAAVAVLKSKDFSKFRYVEEESSEVSIGNVVRTEPEEGKSVKVNREITIYISKGAKQLMPTNVVGKVEQEAAQILEGQGFVVKRIYIEDADKENGVVTQQSSSGQVLSQGAEITLTVVRNIEIITLTVPDLSGETDIEKIKTIITEAGFQVGEYHEQRVDNPDELGVYWQSIEAGKQYMYNKGETPPEISIEFIVNISSGYKCVYTFTEPNGRMQEFELIVTNGQGAQIAYRKFANTTQVSYEYTSDTPDKVTFELYTNNNLVDRVTMEATINTVEENRVNG